MASTWYEVPVLPNRFSIAFPSISVVTSCVPTVTLASKMGHSLSSALTTVTMTDLIFARSIVSGSGSPSLFTFTGTVTSVSLPLIFAFTVTVPLVGAGTCFTVAPPSSSVVSGLCATPLPSTSVTVAPSTGGFPFTTVIFTSLTRVSSIVPSVGLLLLFLTSLITVLLA